mmetsp:Transcript_32468/g.103371  ORF Transcript_32468/g.103371 Transcript_32468/m.103371 type:complete len:238 (-) Transcript_32468:195-908(-)
MPWEAPGSQRLYLLRDLGHVVFVAVVVPNAVLAGLAVREHIAHRCRLEGDLDAAVPPVDRIRHVKPGRRHRLLLGIKLGRPLVPPRHAVHVGAVLQRGAAAVDVDHALAARHRRLGDCEGDGVGLGGRDILHVHGAGRLFRLSLALRQQVRRLLLLPLELHGATLKLHVLHKRRKEHGLLELHVLLHELLHLRGELILRRGGRPHNHRRRPPPALPLHPPRALPSHGGRTRAGGHDV